MPNFGNSRYYENYLMDLFSSVRAYNKASVMVLGGIAGPSGGLGGPPGGFIGYLPQTRVAYDTSEASSLLTPVSGMTLLDNLNHIRGRITVLEEVPNLAVTYNDAYVMSGVGIMNFTGSGVTVTTSEASHVDININATPITFATLEESQAGVIGDKAVPPSGLPLRVINDALIRADGFGGNARGQYAVDLQRNRTSDDQVAGSDYSVLLGGANNRILPSGKYETIVGGILNSISPVSPSQNASEVIIGGSNNDINGLSNDSVICGGYNNTIERVPRSFIGGGYNNLIDYSTSPYYSAIIGGYYNTVRAGYSSAIGGHTNKILDTFLATVIAGRDNTIHSSSYSSVMGGRYNTISGGGYNVVLGGTNNTISGTPSYNTILGGRYNNLGGNNSAAFGYRAVSLFNGTVVFSDTRDYNFSTEMDDEMALRFKKLRFVTALDTSGSPTTSGAFIVTSGYSTFGMPLASPYLTVGDAANYTIINSEGHQTMAGTARPWRDELGELLLKAKSGTRITNDLTEGTVVFSDTCVIADDWVIMNVQLNHDKDLQSDLHPHLHFIQTTSGIPNWLLHHRWQTNGLVKTTGWTYGEWTNLAFEYSSGNLNQIVEFPPITPPSGVSISDIVQFKLYRDTDNDSTLFDGLDPIVGDVSAYMFDIHFQIDSLGSDDEYVK